MQYRKVHMVGIGGAGMSAIASILLDRGVHVSGSDVAASARTEDIQRRGGRFFLGHRSDHVGDPDVVVVSSAVPPDNPEVKAARRRGIPVWPRARMLGELMAGTSGMAVAGTHGKTTTTSMLGFILHRAGLDPTVLIGGELEAFGSNARSGRGTYTVVEADESDRSLLLLSPKMALVTNVDEDHLERFDGIDDIQRTFATFLRQLPPDGLAVLCADDARTGSLVREAPCRVVLYGLTFEADPGLGAAARRYAGGAVELGAFGASFTLARDGVELGRVSLRVPGRHNIMNAIGASALALEVGVSFRDVSEALAEFQGPKRRFEVLGEVSGVIVVDDYAHHPTEVRAALAAARSTGRRVVVVFQPHRFTRTQRMMQEFANSFDDADIVVLTDIYPAGEPPIPGVDAALLAERIGERTGKGVHVVPDLDHVARELMSRVRVGDLVLTLGAGDVRRAALELLRHLGQPDVAADTGRAAEEAVVEPVGHAKG